MSDLIANARMYSVAPAAAAAWKRLFVWLKERSGIDMTVIDHAFPASLDELWSRRDLACTSMCGWPFMRYGAIHQVVAAPIPSAAYAKGRPVYCSHFVVRDDAPFKTLEDTFGHRFAYTIPDSHSGYNAPRHHLLSYRKGGTKALYREIIGPLRTPRLMVEAIVEGKAEGYLWNGKSIEHQFAKVNYPAAGHAPAPTRADPPGSRPGTARAPIPRRCWRA